MNFTYKLAAAMASYISDVSNIFSALLENNATVRNYDILCCELNLDGFDIILLFIFVLKRCKARTQ